MGSIEINHRSITVAPGGLIAWLAGGLVGGLAVGLAGGVVGGLVAGGLVAGLMVAKGGRQVQISLCSIDKVESM